ncbi:MAG: xanthine dehydrogenase family protein molybdopterin-binding subunit [Moorea sp. SIO3I7]|uniref:xanthine dehydrogenase family protein molybdopterin-binding subunit n=1 Tax=unclassified Moorena TaxID=2683338 RepID=UPI0013C11FB7|nr:MULTISPECIES: xanthine dehydrogenase family protein molybdopterin-binding subunit [unclassified Moorena]NEN94058.1 xanthine dehydrogenase family protein molybdopterin-binding subunit [Moorena sp. SIO3I7]NEO05038.1 xanthine dehydrogenase family protein molybdopterin-binding subunit [Moorena sp. SIO3I8]NEO18315.1 xanthine dehydrogenase family protein molybdopterin-binding subunit [Moorena sp. SIO4A5]NEP21910.1 xanthine dehydrogenase family protein molybdopterin-binding subunit [Moorena sp. SIO
MNQVTSTSINRKDGRAKVTGTATYAAEHQIPGLVHGYLVTANIAHGQIKSIDTQAAATAPGVIAVFTHKNPPTVSKPANDFLTSKIYEARLPLSDDQIYYAGQIIGLVVADTFERARHAAHLVKVEYVTQEPIVETSKATFNEAPPMLGQQMTFEKGNVAAGYFASAMAGVGAEITATYTTSTELHAAMEPHAIIAHWQDADTLTVYEPSQWVIGSQRTYADLFGLAPEKVRIITPFIGGAFGSKAFPWPHAILGAAAARQLQRPLKVVLSRRQMTANTGHRSETEQTIRLGANADGSLMAIDHGVKSCTSPVEIFTEPCTGITPVMYAAPNLRTRQELAVMNVGTPAFMRAPGENPGLWALESAMDELAWELKIDPVELRLKNETKEHQRQGLPFSAKDFAECLRLGAQQFGWQDRPKQVRSLTRDGKLIGWGMAASTFPALRSSATVTVRLLADGTAHILTSANDMGTGAYTIVAGTAAEVLGLAVEQVRVEMGDSLLPNGGMAGGSQMTATLVPAVMAACEAVLKTAHAATAQEAFATLHQSGQAAFEATASSAAGEEGKKWAFQSWGAHFCEVSVDEDIARLRVNRWVSVMNIGRVMNAKTAASQIRGGVIMGIGHALMEACDFDPNIGYPVVYDLATYHYPSHADIPRIQVTFVGEPDYNFNPAGVRGLGEIGITGVSAAIANAIYHATGKRIRDLPITPDKLL